MTELTALCAPRPELDLFCDATFQDAIKAGAWAYSVPSFGIAESALVDVPSVHIAEKVAAVEAISRAALLDRTSRPLRIHTDSDPAFQFLQSAIKRKSLPAQNGLQGFNWLLERVVDIVSQRQLVPLKVKKSRPEHMDCHVRAAQTMRNAFRTDPYLAWRLALWKEETRMQVLVKEQTTLRSRLDELEDEALLVDLRIRALKTSSLTRQFR